MHDCVLMPTVTFKLAFLLQLPGREDINCDHISEVVVQLIPDGSSKMTEVRQEGSVTSLTSLLEPYSVYTILVAYRNSGSYISSSDILVINRTLEAGMSDNPITAD